MESESDSVSCKFCEETLFDTSQQLFEHLLTVHDKEHALCTFCHRYFYSKSELDAHIALHKCKRKGYIQCSFCSHSCLSKVTSVQHATKHCKELFLEDSKSSADHLRKLRLLGKTPNNDSKDIQIAQNYANGFSLFSMTCMLYRKKNGGNVFQCSACKKRYDDIQEFIKHKKDEQCVSKEIRTSISESVPQENISDSDVMQKTLDNSVKIISVETFPAKDTIENESSVPSEELHDVSEDQNVPANCDEKSTINETNDVVPVVKFVVKPSRGYGKIPSTSEANKQYITPEDDPIAEFLKIPAKNSSEPKTLDDIVIPAVKPKQTKRPRAIKTVKPKAKQRRIEETKVSTKNLMQNIFAPVSVQAETIEEEYVEEVMPEVDDTEKEEIYLKEVKTLEMLTCDICKQMFSNSHFLNQHKAVHEKYIAQNKYFCKFCNYKRFSKVTLLLEHVARLHKTAKLYECCICSEFFNKQVYFSKHIKDVHPDVTGKFKFDKDSGSIIFEIRVEKDPTIMETEVVTEKDLTNISENLDITDVTVDLDASDANQINNETESNLNTTTEASVDRNMGTGDEKIDTVDTNDAVDVEEMFVEEHLEPIHSSEVVAENDETRMTQNSADSQKHGIKSSVVVLEDISKLLEDGKTFKRSKRLQLKKQTKLKKKKMTALKKKLKEKGRTLKGLKKNVTVRKTNSNIVIKVKNPEDINSSYVNNASSFRLRCHFCSKRFKDEFAFHLHIKSHFQDDSYLCICGVRLATEEELKEHKQKYHRINADIVLIKVNEESYMFVQPSSTLTLQGVLKKVDVPSENPLKFTKLPDNTEYMGDVIFKRFGNEGNIYAMKNKPSTQTKISIKRITANEAMLRSQNTIKMNVVSEGIKPLAKPFEVKSTYVSPDLEDNMYNAVTHVKKLLTKKKITNNFLLNYDTFDMPEEIGVDGSKPTKKLYVKCVKPLSEQDMKNVTLVSSNPLAHLMSDPLATIKRASPMTKKKKELDYEAIIKKNLSNLASVRSPKKKPL